MNETQTTIIKPAIPPGVIKDNAAFVSKVIDKTELLQADYGEFIVTLGAIDATMAVFKVMESDVKTDADTLGGTPSLVKDATTKPGASDGNKLVVIGLDLSKSRKRYLQLQATAGNGDAGTYLAAVFVARRPMEASATAARRGLLLADYA